MNTEETKICPRCRKEKRRTLFVDAFGIELAECNNCRRTRTRDIEPPKPDEGDDNALVSHYDVLPGGLAHRRAPERPNSPPNELWMELI